jgi:hypothetical protein
MNVRRRKVVGHRIQDGKAVVDIVLYREGVPMPDSWPVKWIGDAYELRDELNAVIADLERKQQR